MTPKDSAVGPALAAIQAARLVFSRFASAFNWRRVPISPIDQFPGNELPDLFAFDIHAQGLVTITAFWDGGDGVQCLTAI